MIPRVLHSIVWLLTALPVTRLASSPAYAHAQQVTTGSKAPEIDLSTLNGAPVKLSALKGHPVILTFWGTWCPSCRQEFPQLVEAYRKHHSEGLEIVAVNQRDQELSTKDVQEFASRYDVPFPVALDVRGRSRRAYRLIGLPTTIFVDRNGTIVFLQPGPVSDEELARGLAMIIPER